MPSPTHRQSQPSARVHEYAACGSRFQGLFRREDAIVKERDGARNRKHMRIENFFRSIGNGILIAQRSATLFIATLKKSQPQQGRVCREEDFCDRSFTSPPSCRSWRDSERSCSGPPSRARRSVAYSERV